MKRNEQLGLPAGNGRTDLLPSAGELERSVPMDTSNKKPFNRESDGSCATSFTETSETNPSEIKVFPKDSSLNGNILKLKNLTLKDTRDDPLDIKGERKEEGGKENKMPPAFVRDVKLENYLSKSPLKIPVVLESRERMESAKTLLWEEYDYMKDYDYIKIVTPFACSGTPREINASKTAGNHSIPSEDTSNKNKFDPKVVKDSSTCVKENEGGKEKDVPLTSAKDMKQDDDWASEAAKANPGVVELINRIESNTAQAMMCLDDWKNLDSEVVLPKSAGKTNTTASEDTDSQKKSKPKWVSKSAGPSLWTLGMRQLSFCEDHFSLDNLKGSAPQDSGKGEKSKEKIEKDWEYVEDGIEMTEDWEFMDKDKGRVEKF